MTTRVFVYGTLKPGHQAYTVLCQPYLVAAQSAIVYGQLYHLPIGYPAVTIAPPTAIVHGTLLSFRDRAVLDSLDDYEQHDPAEMAWHYPGIDTRPMSYQRLRTPVYSTTRCALGEAWIYVMASAHIQALGGIHQPSGSWRPTGNSPNNISFP